VIMGVRSGHLKEVIVAPAAGLSTAGAGSASMARVTAEPSHAQRVADLVELHYDFVWRVTRRLGVSTSETEDAVQQVFWVVSRKLGEIQTGRERAYLVGVAVRVASDFRRTVARRRESGHEPPDLPSAAPGAEELLDRRRARELLDRFLDALNPELRQAFVLFELENLQSREIAELLDIPTGTVASRLRRARDAFNAEVERWQCAAPGRRNP
jgi:RNA polymerase sigma-70 factor (ECF subfamily)